MATLRRIEKGAAGSRGHGHGSDPVTRTLGVFPTSAAKPFLDAFFAGLMIVAGILAGPASAQPQPPQTAPASPASFADVTRASGIDFHLTCGSLEKRYIMESMCGGVAVLDYDNDGWMDIFLVNGSTLEDVRAGKCHPGKL